MKRRFQSRNNLLHPRNFEFQRWKREQRGGGAVLDKYLFQIIRTVPFCPHFRWPREESEACNILGRKASNKN